MEKPLVIGIGEVLWDLLPKGKQLGGAPANFALHAHELGANGIIVSAVGDDELGREIERTLSKRKIETRYLQMRPRLPTGTVSVEVDVAGTPRYTIHENVAWDMVAWDEDLTELAMSASAVCFGTLAQRSFVTRSTIHALLQHTRGECLRVFDVNLRQSYYTQAVVEASLSFATVLKLNDEEWPTLAEMAGVAKDITAGEREMMERYELALVAVTRGARGSVIVTPDAVDEKPAAAAKIVDTVGAGDAFTAALTMGLLRGMPLDQVHRVAADVAGFVCSQHGASPSIPGELKRPIMKRSE